MTVERSAFVVRVVCYLAFGTFLVVCNLVFDYARIRTVVEDRHSASARSSPACDSCAGTRRR